MAPEIFRQCYSDKVDIWATGLMVYEMLLGHSAFKSQGGRNRIMDSVVAGQVYYGKSFKALSAEAQDFVKGLLQVNPALRLSAADALRHPFLAPTLCGILEAPKMG